MVRFLDTLLVACELDLTGTVTRAPRASEGWTTS